MKFMNKKRYLVIPFFYFLCLMSIAVQSQQAIRSEIITASINTLKSHGKNVTEEDVDSVYRIEKNGNVLLFEVVFRSGEEVLLSGNKACMPIIGYSLSTDEASTFPVLSNYEELPSGLKDILSEYMEQIEIGYDKNRQLQTHADWAQLMNYRPERQINSIVVGPLLSSQWGQGESNCGEDTNSYNYYVTQTCNNSNHNCYAGCGAVAMAQIMYFWKHPVFSIVRIEQFDWCNMSDMLNTHEQDYFLRKKSVARLIKDCGESIDMDYCVNPDCESSSTIDDVPDAFNQFAYACSSVKKKNNYSEDEWLDMIKDNLDNNMPVYYCGHGSGGACFCV